MNIAEMRREPTVETLRAGAIDMKLEVVVIPVSDVDRAKRFYSDLGWRLDLDYTAGDDFRVIQFTPPGSGCSVIFGKNVTAAAPGSAKGLHLIVSDIAGRPRRTAPPWHQDQRAISRRRRRIPPCRRGRPGQRPKSAAKKLRLVRLVQRPGRQRLGVAGGHRAIDRTHRGGRHKLHLRA